MPKKRAKNKKPATTARTHNVTVVTPSLELTKADVTFTIDRQGERIGRLLVSYGSVVWKPRNKQLGYRMVWSKFDEVMQAEGRKLRGK